MQKSKRYLIIFYFFRWLHCMSQPWRRKERLGWGGGVGECPQCLVRLVWRKILRKTPRVPNHVLVKPFSTFISRDSIESQEKLVIIAGWGVGRSQSPVLWDCQDWQLDYDTSMAGPIYLDRSKKKMSGKKVSTYFWKNQTKSISLIILPKTCLDLLDIFPECQWVVVSVSWAPQLRQRRLHNKFSR